MQPNMAENEKTSPEVASIASEILKMNQPYLMTTVLWEKIKTLAGSALTQTEDKPPRKLRQVKPYISSAANPLNTPNPLTHIEGISDFIKNLKKDKK